MKWVISLMLVIIGVGSAVAEVPPEPPVPELTLALSSANDAVSAGAAFACPFEKRFLNGYFAVTAQHIHVGGETHQSQRLVYLEAGVPFRALEFNVFGKVLNNRDRDLGRQSDGGYFVQVHGKHRGALRFSGGFGNFARHEITELSAAAQSTFHWKLFVRVMHTRGLTVQYETNMGIDLGDREHSLTPQYSAKITERLHLTVSGVLIHADDLLHSSFNIGAKMTF